ncbi:MAG: galactose-1-phosphate uridylyltransferase [Candidatus Azambacteria bacterium]|nr:galactose-1-phosphate uridylyltransferase [Candidatus Azambacteria bacterium]
MKNKKNNLPLSEFRQDPVSDDWVLLAPLRGAEHKFEGRIKTSLSKNKCPFDNLTKFGNAPPVLVYQNDKGTDWFLQIIPNKYPAITPGDCQSINQKDLYRTQAGVGSHDLIIYRDHSRNLAEFNKQEIHKILLAFQERYRTLAKDKCVQYISIFHNHGKEAGSTVPHPHSQMLSLPIIPPDVSHSINGAKRYFSEHKKCAHCQVIEKELQIKKRIVYQNQEMIVVTPFASRAEFELRIFPKKHSAHFDKIEGKELEFLADALRSALSKIYQKLKDPAFNFFIHTAPPAKNEKYDYYHWHIEILPKFDILGGFELGTGADIITIAPETAAKILK